MASPGRKYTVYKMPEISALAPWPVSTHFHLGSGSLGMIRSPLKNWLPYELTPILCLLPPVSLFFLFFSFSLLLSYCIFSPYSFHLPVFCSFFIHSKVHLSCIKCCTSLLRLLKQNTKGYVLYNTNLFIIVLEAGDLRSWCQCG